MPDKEPMDEAMIALLANTVERITQRDANNATRAAAKPEKFLAWLDSYFNQEHADHVATQLAPVLRVAGGLDVPVAESLAQSQAQLYRRGMHDAILEASGHATPAELSDAVATLFKTRNEFTWQNAARILKEVCHA